MTTFTKEQLIKFANAILQTETAMASWDCMAGQQAKAGAAIAEIALASLEAEAVSINDNMAYAFHHALSDSSLGADEVEEIKTGLCAAFANVTALVVPETLPCSVLLEPGLRLGKGIKTQCLLDALSRRAVYESDLAALSPEEKAEWQKGIEEFKEMLSVAPQQDVK